MCRQASASPGHKADRPGENRRDDQADRPKTPGAAAEPRACLVVSLLKHRAENK